MGIFTGCLIACDVDGTLLENETLPQVNLDKIKFFTDNGGYFALATGRSIGSIGKILKYFDKLGPCVTANGSVIYDFSQNKVLYEQVIPKSDHIILKNIMEKFPEIGIEIHTGYGIYRFNPNREALDHEIYEELDIKTVDFSTADTLNWSKVLYLPPDTDSLNRLTDYALGCEVNSDFTTSTAVIAGRTRRYFEQIPKGISKASAVLRLAQILKVKPGGLFAVGDYYNDLDMLICADISAAPETSPEDIKSRVSHITVPAKSGAVADFIDYLHGKLSVL